MGRSWRAGATPPHMLERPDGLVKDVHRNAARVAMLSDDCRVSRDITLQLKSSPGEPSNMLSVATFCQVLVFPRFLLENVSRSIRASTGGTDDDGAARDRDSLATPTPAKVYRGWEPRTLCQQLLGMNGVAWQ